MYCIVILSRQKPKTQSQKMQISRDYTTTKHYNNIAPSYQVHHICSLISVPHSSFQSRPKSKPETKKKSQISTPIPVTNKKNRSKGVVQKEVQCPQKGLNSMVKNA
jgi:hypothetical protein